MVSAAEQLNCWLQYIPQIVTSLRVQIDGLNAWANFRLFVTACMLVLGGGESGHAVVGDSMIHSLPKSLDRTSPKNDAGI